MLHGFRIITTENKRIHFHYDSINAPRTCEAFASILPFTRTFMHAKRSGEEIWIDNPPYLDIPQENSSIFTEPGEVVFGPIRPTRNRTANCMGIYYGQGQGLDGCNIFAKVVKEDLSLLKELGDTIWKQGMMELTFEDLV